MRGVNKTTIIGNLGADPKSGYTANGTAAARLNVGVSSEWKDAEGIKQEHTEWFKVVLYGPRAEAAVHYLRKGARVYFEGEQRTRKYDQDKYITELNVRDMIFLDGKPAENTYPAKPSSQAPSAASPPQIVDDDIPF